MLDEKQLTVINSYVKQLKEENIKFYNEVQVPEWCENHPAIVRAERELGIRISTQKGFDVIRNSFFVVETLINRNDLGDIVEKKVIRLFTDFKSYYEFLDGDIYGNDCYFQYDFAPEEITEFHIDESRINTSAFINATVEDFSAILTEKELRQYNDLEEDKILREEWISKFNTCGTYEEFKIVLRDLKSSNFSDLDFFLFNFIFADQEKAFDIIIQYISDVEEKTDFIFNICAIYGFEKVKERIQNKNIKEKIKRHIARLQNGSVESKEKGFFDEKTHFFCYQKSIYINGYKNAYFYRYFRTLQELAAYLDNDLSGCSFSAAILPNVDFSIYKTDKYTKLPIQNTENLTYTLYKEYDRYNQRFIVKQIWTNKDNQIIKERKHSFMFFFDFVYFLKNDLSNAKLQFCDGMIYLSNLSNINIQNAKIRSGVLDKLGLEYSLYNIDTEKTKMFPITMENENNTFFELKARNEHYSIAEAERADKYKFYYISDLHLLHRIINAQCRSEGDALYTIQKIIDDMLYEVRLEYFGKSVILIGGDTSSDFELFKCFIYLLRQSIDRKKLDIQVIFVLGNHELWEFENCSFDEITYKYETVIKEQGMYLLQNDIIYISDDGLILKITTEDIVSSSRETIRGKLRNARIILFGGLAFSGYNEKFNANCGLYRVTITRNQELAESKAFEELYNKVRSTLYDKNVIIFTHTPQEDWCSYNNPQFGFVYVNGHTHKNIFYDDGEYRIYADNQIGYKRRNTRLKYFYLDSEYDWFSDYEDGIYEITKEDYLNFNRGKNIWVQFTRNNNTFYMLKKNGYYCFIAKHKGKLAILNGGAKKNLDEENIDYYYEKMDDVIAYIEKPLVEFTSMQKVIADAIKSIGGDGTIHGAIIDIDYFSHIYVNPDDLTFTGYWAKNVIDKTVFPSIPQLLKEKCYPLYVEYTKLLKGKAENAIALKKVKSRN